jgi:hypothetical protein
LRWTPTHEKSRSQIAYILPVDLHKDITPRFIRKHAGTIGCAAIVLCVVFVAAVAIIRGPRTVPVLAYVLLSGLGLTLGYQYLKGVFINRAQKRIE